MPWLILTLMTEASRGVLDTSVLIDHDQIIADQLPDESAITAVTLAELSAGPHATENKDERARRQDRLQWATATWDPLPFDADSARMCRISSLGDHPVSSVEDHLIS